MAHKPKILTVPEGATGISSNTAYTVICAGTTNTGNFQNVSGVGSLGQLFVSNGASALPSFQTVSATGGGYAVLISTQLATPTDLQTYYLQNGFTLSANSAATGSISKISIMQSGTINKVYGAYSVTGVIGTSEAVSLAIRLNNTTDYSIASLNFSAASGTFNTSSLGVPVSIGNYVTVKLVCPNWATTPTNVSISLTFMVE